MCSIYGAFGPYIDQDILLSIQSLASDRGRDGGGMVGYRHTNGWKSVLGNWRATPTPEIVAAKPQPYLGIVHNGTIANDKELGRKEGEVDSEVLPRVLRRDSLSSLVSSLQAIKGSYALVAHADDTVYLACNYKPLHYWTPDGRTVYFSSMERHFRDVIPFGMRPQQLEPYTAIDLFTKQVQRIPRNGDSSVVVIASGGLDSTVAAAKLRNEGHKVHLLHFLYGCHAETREVNAVGAIAEALDCGWDVIRVPLMSSSRLLQGDEIAPGIEGAEYAHEWVPARNLAFLGLAVAFAEARGFHAVALGNNLEEAASYPDNSEQLTFLLDKAMPYTVQNGYEMHVLSPVGNLMKHEIVKEGLACNAPLHLTWSCYRGREKQCGECGPCFMRREAFRRNNAQDPCFTE